MPKTTLHKVKIHHNRWLIWAIAYVLLVAIAMVGYIKVSDENQEFLIAENDFKPWHSYWDNRLGFKLNYPAGWAIEADNDSTVTFTPPNTDVGVLVSKLPLASEMSVRKELKITKEEAILVNDLPAAKIWNQLSEGHFEQVVLVKQGKNLFVIRGTPNLVSPIIQTISFLPNE